ncbi:MAG: hypothetical protein WC524_03500 [Candidatus Aminicenantales bacterium]
MADENILLIEESLMSLSRWVEEKGYKGYDPADGLTSILRPLTFKKLLLERILQQAIWKSPINLRPLFGVKPLDSCIARGFFARGYLKLYKLTGISDFKDKAGLCLEWLIQNKSPYSEEYAWGKMFDFSSRGGRQKKYEPITVWTSLIGQAFLDAYEIMDNKHYLSIAESVCRWILSVPKTLSENGFCINYTASQQEQCTIHNQSILAAFMLARTSKYNKNRKYLDTAKQAVRFTCEKQRADGSWLYGEDQKFHWIDNFHTGYVLDGLKGYIESTGDQTYHHILEKGFRYYVNNFFTAEGAPKYYHNSLYPIDIQCASQSIDTLAFFADYDLEAINLALKVAGWTIANMQDRKGYFYFRQYPFIKSKVPMIHWGQATMFKALACLLFILKRN